MASKEIAEKRYKEGKCARCGKTNDRLPLKSCSICAKFYKNRDQTPRRKEYNKKRNQTPRRKEYNNKYLKEYCKTPKFKDMNKRYKLKRVEEGRCWSCGRPLLMGETTKNCKMCNERQFQFKWD